MFKNIFSKKSITTKSNAEAVGAFYNKTTDQFLEVYGEIIQAFRTNNVEDYLDYTIESAQLGEHQLVLDAGCGVCGPSLYFAKKFKSISIDACTISEVQHEKALENVKKAELDKRVRPHRLDYHTIDENFVHDSYDRVIFLESFGHSNNKPRLIDAAFNILKPGGKLYIKDLFRRVSDEEWMQLKIDKICDDIDRAYCYNIGDLNAVLAKIRSKGFLLEMVKIPQVEQSKFEHLTISNDFQNLFNIGKIDSWDEYVFPIDFYEIIATKPVQLTSDEIHLYFMNRKNTKIAEE